MSKLNAGILFPMPHSSKHRQQQIHSFIHSGHFYSAPTTQRRSPLQHRYCIGVSRRSEQATAGKGLAQGPYMAARAGVEPTTLRLKAIDSTKAPPRPTWWHLGKWTMLHGQ